MEGNQFMSLFLAVVGAILTAITLPLILELLAVTEGVHGLPEAAMKENLNRAAGDEGAHGFLLEHLAVVRDVVEDVKIEH